MNKAVNELHKSNSSNQGSMTLSEARKVMWLSTNRRPMGELFDKGFLTRWRLEWAAKYAYDDRIKQAAKVFLNGMDSSTVTPAPESKSDTLNALIAPFHTGITVDEARSTLWPFRPYTGQPMGTLFDNNQLSLRDLGYAIETAWDARVRAAATTLTLLRLQQLVEESERSSGFLQVKSGGKSYAERQQYLFILLQGTVAGIFFGVMLALLFWSIWGRSPSESPTSLSEILTKPAGITALLLVVVLSVAVIRGLLFVFAQIMNWFDKRIERHRIGQEGEDRVETIISQVLDGEWTLFRNILLPGRQRGDLDAVLVGSTGVWVLEVKSYNGEYRNIGDHWEYRSGNKWTPARKNPSRQAKSNASRLGDFLTADGIKQWVNPVVVWANPESSLIVENPSVAVWMLERLPDELGNICQGKPIPTEKQAAIVDKLSKLCERQQEAP